MTITGVPRGGGSRGWEEARDIREGKRSRIGAGCKGVASASYRVKDEGAQCTRASWGRRKDWRRGDGGRGGSELRGPETLPRECEPRVESTLRSCPASRS